MGTLLEDIKDWYKEESYPPDGEDVDAKLVSEKDTGDLRWGTSFTNVYSRDIDDDSADYVAVHDVRPATEYQSWGDYGDPDIYEVYPVTKTVTVTKYVKKGSA